jgi:hypothetical protein
MKPKLRDYLTIIFALLVIFACGCGVGFLLGEKKGRQETETPNAIGSEHDSGNWEKQTMESLESRLELSDRQREKILGEIQATSLEITKNQEAAIEDHYRVILALHDRLIPHLELDQQAKIKKDRNKLQRTINLRFK